MTQIRPATPADASRIAEIIITNYRQNFYPFFRNDAYYFGELNVMDMAAEYTDGSDALKNTYVYDDGVVKGIIRISGDEIEKLFIEPTFQSHGIGAKLLDFAVSVKHASWLWVLEYNERGIAFYERNGFTLTGEKIIEDEWVPLLKMKNALQSARNTIRRIFLELGAESADTNGGMVFVHHGEYFRLDEMTIHGKLFFVIECGTEEDFRLHRMEDADPFPYDLSEEELRREIKQILEINP